MTMYVLFCFFSPWLYSVDLVMFISGFGEYGCGGVERGRAGDAACAVCVCVLLCMCVRMCCANPKPWTLVVPTLNPGPLLC